MRLKQPTHLPQFSLNNDEREVLRELTEHLEDRIQNAGNPLFLRATVDMEDDTYDTIMSLVRAINEYYDSDF